MKKIIVSALLILLLLPGCRDRRSQPYVRPDVDAPPVYRGAEGQPDAESFANLVWWEVYGDPQLQSLIGTALDYNKDLRMAVERVVQAQAQAGITNSYRYPSVDLEAGVVDSENGSGRFAQVVLNYEIDLWGQLKSASQADRALVLASIEAQRAVVSSLVSDVASSYFSLVSLDSKLQLAERTLQTRQESLELVKLREQHGHASMLDVEQAQVLVKQASAAIPDLERQIAQTENRISILTGDNPGPIERGDPMEMQSLLPDVPPGLPSEILERRPDIRYAEQLLIAANADIRAARAALYPSIFLTGARGTASGDLERVLLPTGTWSIAASLLQPIFNAGRIRQGIKAAESRERESALYYQQIVQNALREVSDALTGRSKLQEVRERQEELVQSLHAAAELANTRYFGGYTSYLEVLDAQRQLFEAQTGLIGIRRDELQAGVVLYRALGGGWQEPVQLEQADTVPSQ